MITFFNDPTILQDDDLVGMLDGGKPVGDHQHRTDTLHLLQGLLYENFGLRINVGRCLIQYQYLRFMDDRTGKGQ